MGLAESFLSRPVEEKFSEDGSNGRMCYGASSMQGWRMRQEDAHNCILDFDDNTSLFAVYDGHGGAEVAAYAAEEFPNCLRNIEEYKKGLFTEALINAFLKFDDSVKTPEVIKRLLQLVVEPKNEDEDDGDQAGENSSGECSSSKVRDDDDNEDSKSRSNEAKALACQSGGSSSGGCSSSKACDDDDYEDFESLRNEAKKPIEEVMASYMNRKLDKILKKLVGTPVNLSCTETNSASASASGSSSNNGQSTVETSLGGSGAAVEQNSSSSNETTSNDTPSNNAEDKSDHVENTKNGSGDHQKSESTNDTENSKKGQEDSSIETLPKRIPKEPSSILGDQPGTSPTKKKLSSLNLKDIDTVKSFITNDEIGESDDDDSEDESFQPSIHDVIQDGDDDDDDDDEDVDENEEEDDDASDEDEELSDEDESDEDDEQDDSLVDWHLSSDEMKRKPGYYSGCTAVVALIRGNDLYVANAGDSRCVLSVNGVAVDMTEDHDPKNAGERRRIIEAGGKVHDGRVQGDLNLSRAFGDHKYKLNANLSNREQMITALPDVKTAKIGPDTDFLVLICDGIWNCMSNQELVDFIRPRFEKKQKLSSICEELFSKCLSPSYLADGGNDNMTCVIVDLHSNRVSSTESSNSDGVKAVKTIPVEVEAANAVASIIEENEPASTESCRTDVTVADGDKKVVEKESLKRKLSDEIISNKKLITEEDLSVNSHENS